jgi:hypothetical protein
VRHAPHKDVTYETVLLLLLTVYNFVGGVGLGHSFRKGICRVVEGNRLATRIDAQPQISPVTYILRLHPSPKPNPFPRVARCTDRLH